MSEKHITTAEQAREKLRACLEKAQGRDHEGAHVLEDELHQGVLLAIADGRAEDPRALAEIAARTLGIDFHRWCG